MTHTRTHVSVTFANPFLVCLECRRPARGYHHGEGSCGCTAGSFLVPCRHDAATESVCPTWGPVDGCTCPKGTH
jgi:hypothetical protein